MSRIRRDLGVVAINNKVTTNTNNISSHTNSIKSLNTTVSGHTSTITEQASSIRSLNTAVSGHTDSITSINTDVTALKKKGWCINGTILTYKTTNITEAGQQTFTYTVQNDCYLDVTVTARDETAGQGAIQGNTYIVLYIGGKTVWKQFENGDSEHDNFEFGLLVKAGATAELTLNAYSPGPKSNVTFQEFKLS